MAEANLLEQLRASGVLPPEQLAEVASLPEARHPDPRVLGKLLWERGYLSRYQVNLVAAGRGKELHVGPYLLLERLGGGGMGQVFKARHVPFKLTVALKLVRKDKRVHPQVLQRFTREVEAIEKLDHPNIVRCLDFGQADGIPYYVMEFVDGTDLSRLVKENGPLPVPVACEYIRQAALGLAAAHGQGIVHRDIKPSNLLVSIPPARGAPVVKVMDMGLARLDEPADGGLNLTRLGQVLGTPDYLAPEQARDARKADARSDLYSLGCSLYFLLAGRPPFHATSLSELLMKHQREVPPSLSQFRQDVPAELDALLARLLAKKPDDRPQTAAEVATALTRLTRDAARPPLATPVSVQPPPPIPGDLDKPLPNGAAAASPRRVRRQGGARPPRASRPGLWVGLAIGVVLGAGLLLALAALFWPGGTTETARVGPDPPTKPKPHPGPDKEKDSPKRPDPPEPLGQVVADGSHLVLRGHGHMVRALAVAPGDRLVASGDEDGTVLVWDLRDRKTTHRLRAPGAVRFLAFSRDGHRLFAGANNRVSAWTLADGKPVAPLTLSGMFPSPDLRSALSFDRPGDMPVLRLWRQGDDKEAGQFPAENVPEIDVRFDRTGRFALVLGRDQMLRVVDVKESRLRLDATPPANKPRPIAGCWGRTERELILACTDRQVRIANLDAPFEGRTVGIAQKEGLFCVALSPDGRHVLAGGGERALHRINLATGRLADRLEGHAAAIRAVVYLSDDKRALSSDADGVLRLWDLRPPTAGAGPPHDPVKVPQKPATPEGPFTGHQGDVPCLALSPDGTQLLTGGVDGTVRLWDIRTGREVRRYHQVELGAVRCVRFSADGRLVLAVGAGPSGQLLEMATGKPVVPLQAGTPKAGTLAAADFAGKGRSIALASGSLLGLRPVKGGPGRTLETKVPITALSRLGETDLLACGDADGQVHLFRAGVSFQRVLTYRPHTGAVRCLDYHPKRMQLLTGSADGSIASRSVQRILAGRDDPPPAQVLARHSGVVTGLAFTGDGLRFISAGADRTVRLWHVTRREELHRFTDEGDLHGLVLLRDDRRVITCGTRIRVWELPAAAGD